MDGESQRISVVVYVDGHRVDVSAVEGESAESLVRRVVEEQHLNRPGSDYELRWYDSGNLLNLTESLRNNGVVAGSILALVPMAGIGG